MQSDRPFSGSTLCVVGNINRDVKTTAFASGGHLFEDGETSVASIVETIGGGGANSAFAAAALGARVGIMGRIGADALGDRLARTCAQHGVADHLARDPRNQTGTSIALSFDSGHRYFISCLPANELFCHDDLNLDLLKDYGHLLRADVWFSESMLFEGNRILFKAANQAAIPVSLDLNWDPQWGRASAEKISTRKQAVRDLLPMVTLAHGNVRELREFTDAPDMDGALQRLLDWGVQGVVVHLGARGAGYFSADGLIVEPPAPVSNPLHTTGTGDVLSVCMMLMHARRDLAIADRLRIANAIVGEFMSGTLVLIPPLSD